MSSAADRCLGKVVRLVERQPDRDTVHQLEALLEEAKAGKIVGLLAAVHYGGSAYAYLGSGSMCSDPSRGLAAAHRLATKLLHQNI